LKKNKKQMNYPPTIQKLIDIFSKFPTVGQRTASRFAFYLIKKNEKEIEELNLAISNLKKNIKLCRLCLNPFEPLEKGKEICSICANPARKKNLLCIVEKESDFLAIEKTKKYPGLYFILGETTLSLKKANVDKERIKILEERIKKYHEITEIILATNPTTEGQATALYLERILKPFNKKITHLGRGLPTGGELEYADEETLSSALEGRK